MEEAGRQRWAGVVGGRRWLRWAAPAVVVVGGGGGSAGGRRREQALCGAGVRVWLSALITRARVVLDRVPYLRRLQWAIVD
jgi:hypothetical protein